MRMKIAFFSWLRSCFRSKVPRAKNRGAVKDPIFDGAPPYGKMQCNWEEELWEEDVHALMNDLHSLMHEVVHVLQLDVYDLIHEGIYDLMYDVHAVIHEGVYDLM